MSIREWFGYAESHKFITNTDSSMDKLLSLYVQALKHYFSVDQVSEYTEFLKAIKEKQLSRDQILFLNWIENKGMKLLRNIAEKSVPDSEEVIAMIDYEVYMLDMGMDFTYPEDIVSSLIDSANLLPEIINPILENSSSQEAEQFFVEEFDNMNEFLAFTETDIYQYIGNVDELYFQEDQESVYLNISDIESAGYADSFFI
ncbi:hypothetical protein ACQKNN_10100 [Bacillus paramycoides]|uniref:hypothetical protein n=1 Tax=Bacillus paramycoides TaxID=2026194 RepID=UPI003B65D2BA